MRWTRPFSVSSEVRFKPSFLRTTPAKKPRTECCCHSVAVMIAAIVAPAGVRSIAMMRACLVAGRAADFDDAGVGRLRDLDLLDFGEAERLAALAVDLGLVMGSSEVHATPSAAPPQPWLVLERSGVDVCMKDPGFAIDLTLRDACLGPACVAPSLGTRRRGEGGE